MSEADALDVEGRNYASFKIGISQVGIKFNSKMTMDTDNFQCKDENVENIKMLKI